MTALDLLSGDAQTFLSKVWASRVHLHRTDPDDLVGLLSLDDADQLLTSTAIRTPVDPDGQGRLGAARVVVHPQRDAGRQAAHRSGRRRARRSRSSTTARPSCSRALHRYWPPLTRLIAELELELGHPCQANAYLTPPGSQGFAVHSDTHDVFVFQTAGSKQWEVHGQDGPEDVLLEPGLSMYLPTGTPHAARAQETVSLHVTLGINQLTWRGLVERTAEARAGRAYPTSTCRPATSTTPPCSPARSPTGWRRSPRTYAAWTRPPPSRPRSGGSSPAARRGCRGGLHDVLARGRGIDDAPLRRRPGHPCVLLDRGDRVEVLLGDRSMTVPAWIRPALEEVRARQTFTAGRPRRSTRRAAWCSAGAWSAKGCWQIA